MTDTFISVASIRSPCLGNAHGSDFHCKMLCSRSSLCPVLADLMTALQPHFHLNLRDAAAALDICPTTLKRTCRRLGIRNWPRKALADAQAARLAASAISEAPSRSVPQRRTLRTTSSLAGMHIPPCQRSSAFDRKLFMGNPLKGWRGALRGSSFGSSSTGKKPLKGERGHFE